MDDLNPSDLTVPQPHFDTARVKPGLREKVLDDASGQFPCGLVLFEDHGNVGSNCHVTSVPSIHKTYSQQARQNSTGRHKAMSHGNNRITPRGVSRDHSLLHS